MRSLIVVLILHALSSGQTTIYGASTKLIGSATAINPGSTFTQIYVVFPPQSDQSPATNNTNFKANVMTQSAIDGVTVPVLWSAVETTAPTTTPCTPVGTHTCQLDSSAAGYYHTYSWGAVDGSGGCSDHTTNSLSQWFCSFGGTLKKVNILLFGITDSPTNTATPSYVTQSWWATATNYAPNIQDVVNTISAAGCGGYTGGTPIPTMGSLFSGNGVNPTISVTWPSHTFVTGDVIWVSGFSGLNTAFNITGQHGATVTVDTGSTFHYTGSGITGSSNSGAGATVIRASDSWPVPFETPYSAAYEAFLRAAIYHFNQVSTLSQIGYIRPGVARGGEALPICTGKLPMTGANPPFTKAEWDDVWYTAVNNTVQNASPLMQILYSLNTGDPTAPDASYATAEAGIAVAHINGVGMYNGFGSQGLAQSDTSFNVMSCPDDSTTPDTGNNWGCMFAAYWSGGTTPTTVPLELQQIDCSNPTGYTGGSGVCFHGGLPGSTGSLATLYQFTTTQHVSIIELYSEDAFLAYDTNYCDPDNTLMVCVNSAGYDWFGTALGSDTQYNFYKHAGQGASCSGSACPYAAAINKAHGYH